MSKKGEEKELNKEKVVDDVIDDGEKVEKPQTKEEIEQEEPKDASKEADALKEVAKDDKKDAKDSKGKAIDDPKDAVREEVSEEEPKDSRSDSKKDDEDAPAPPPPKPKRPLSPRSQAKKNLAEAFPTIEEPYITAVLIASNYKLEPAFNALLYISDPTVNPQELAEAAYPPVVPKKISQLEQDELLAKQLDEEYNKREHRRQRRGERERQRSSIAGDEEDEENFFDNFVEKDLPEIKAQFSKNIEETKNKFNSWVSGWKTNFNNQQDQLQSQRQKKQNLRPFDEDPEEVDLRKFHGIELKDDAENEKKPSLANRDRAGSTDLYGTPKTKKWEPLKSTKPEPTISAGDDDDFLLSDDEV